MASEPAEPTTRPQDDRVGTVRRLGNSWFVKLVEPASDPWHVVCSDGQQDVSGWQDDESMEDCPVVGYLPVVECVPSLLADPAQTTELEKRLDETQQKLAEADRLYADLLGQREQWWESVAKQRGEVEAQRDALSLLLRGMARRTRRFRLLMNINYREVCDAKDVIDQAFAERDERQARITDAVAKLKAADNLIVDWQPSLEEWAKAVSLIVHARAALVGDQGKHLGENQAELGGPKALTSGNSWANRDLDLSGAALRAVEEAGDAAGDLP